jgi:hypothetical protein
VWPRAEDLRRRIPAQNLESNASAVTSFAKIWVRFFRPPVGTPLFVATCQVNCMLVRIVAEALRDSVTQTQSGPDSYFVWNRLAHELMREPRNHFLSRIDAGKNCFLLR